MFGKTGGKPPHKYSRDGGFKKQDTDCLAFVCASSLKRALNWIPEVVGDFLSSPQTFPPQDYIV